LRNQFIEQLIIEARSNERIVLITADLGYGVLERFSTEFPDRFFNLGIAEQSIMSIAAGLASKGFRPFVYSIGNFPTFRCLEQIRNDVSYMNNGVVIVALGAGFSYGTAGYSHYLIEDLSAISALENIEIFNPATSAQVTAITSLLAQGSGPAYLRLGALEECKLEVTQKLSNFAEMHCSGENGAILVTGPLLSIAHEAREILSQEGSVLGIISVFNLSSFDLKEIPLVEPHFLISVEEHKLRGGFYSMILEKANILDKDIRISGVGIENFKHSLVGKRDFMLSKYNITPQSIVSAFHRLGQ
jgi:transketolase